MRPPALLVWSSERQAALQKKHVHFVRLQFSVKDRIFAPMLERSLWPSSWSAFEEFGFLKTRSDADRLHAALAASNLHWRDATYNWALAACRLIRTSD
jgi:hypothetical protein